MLFFGFPELFDKTLEHAIIGHLWYFILFYLFCQSARFHNISAL